MRMARKLRNKGFEVTCPAEFRQGRSGGTQDLVFWVRIGLGGLEYLGVLDTGATISIADKIFLPCGSLQNIMTSAAIRMGDGHVSTAAGTVKWRYLWAPGLSPIGSMSWTLRPSTLYWN